MSNIIPSFRYKNAPEAIEWLCDTFGFKKHLVVPGENNTILHAQLTLGNGMIMLGSGQDNEYGKLFKTPEEVNGYNTSSCYILVDDIDAHYEQTRKAGAKMVLELEEQEYGGKLYTCLDPEGHVWNFGSYDPWAEGE